MSHLPPAPGHPEPALPTTPATAELRHEDDVLKRRNRFSWREFGGDGFLVSVSLHVLLGLIAVGYAVQVYTTPPKVKADPVFEPSGRRGSGEKPATTAGKIKPVKSPVKSVVRVVATGTTSAGVLPALPDAPTATFATGGLSGGALGKGTANGLFDGQGNGTAKNLNGMFRNPFCTATGAGLPGTFYDLKQFADGTPSPMAKDTKAYEDFMRGFFKTWDAAKLAKYFKSEQPMSAERIFVPLINDTAAPAAFEVGDKVKAGRWLVIYQGKVTAPFTGKMRFWGVGDDMMLVNWNGKNVLDSGYYLATAPAPGNGRGYHKAVLGSDVSIEKGVHSSAQVPYRGSVWLDVVKGREYPVKIAIGEIYGGKCSYHLLWEKLAPGKTDEGDGRMQVFQMSGEAMPESALATIEHHGSFKNGGAGLDVLIESPIWKAQGVTKRLR